MSRQRATLGKLQREREKHAKATAKRDRRQQGRADVVAAGDVDVESFSGSASELLALIERIHHQFENEEISFEEYDAHKATLLALLPVD